MENLISCLETFFRLPGGSFFVCRRGQEDPPHLGGVVVGPLAVTWNKGMDFCTV